ncbi:hypothetical protein [Gordonia paraffinivorans]|uniref:hypothetical protein n=1 Tax=Gordonia paraffinivorans TaxID=175628 RepID=UPI00144627CC|nr:hypothetical protein [Gordonia paraffinivorans]
MKASNIRRRLTVGVATVAAVCGLGLVGAPMASAASVEPTPAFGSVSLCFGVPIGPVSVSICI